MTLRRALGAALGAVVLGALAYVAVRRLDLALLVVAIGQAHMGWLLATTLLYFAILPLWALQWRLLAPAVPHNTVREMYGVVASSSALHNTAAYFAGEVTGALLLVSRIGLTRTAAVSVILMDQLFVGIAKLAVVSVAALAAGLPAWMSQGIAALAAGVAFLLLAGVGGALRFDAIAAAAVRVGGERGGRLVTHMGSALAPLLSSRIAGGALVLAMAKQVVEVLAIVCVLQAFGEPASLVTAVLVLAALTLATILPLVPGNLGVFEAAVTFVLVSRGMPAEQALAVAVVLHACYMAALVLPGYGWVAVSGSARRATAAP